MSTKEKPILDELLTHRNRVLSLRSWLGGAAFADERGWLDPDENERFTRETQRWPETLRDLGKHVRRVRRQHREAFLAWIDQEIEACTHEIHRRNGRAADRQTARDHLARWKAVLAGTSEDFHFGDFPDGPVVDGRLTVRALAGDGAAQAKLAQHPPRMGIRHLKSTLGLPRATPSKWVADGCPAIRENRRLLFDPVALIGWFDAHGYPEGANSTQALARLARCYDTTASFLAVSYTTSSLSRITAQEITGPETDASAELDQALWRCHVSMCSDRVPVEGAIAIRDELTELVREGLLFHTGGKPPRRLEGEERWRIAAWSGTPHGGLYELELDRFWAVYDWNTRTEEMCFQGTYEASYTGEGSGWGDRAYSGTVDVKISSDCRHVCVTSASGEIVEHPLPA